MRCPPTLALLKASHSAVPIRSMIEPLGPTILIQHISRTSGIFSQGPLSLHLFERVQFDPPHFPLQHLRTSLAQHPRCSSSAMARPKVPLPPAIPALPPVPAPHDGWRRRSLRQRLLQNLRCTFEWIFFRELPLLQLMAPSVFRPDFTWGHRMLAPEQLAKEIPPSPPLLAPALRRLTGHIHSFLCGFSRYYCEWFGFPFSYSIATPTVRPPSEVVRRDKPR
ncbi:hypothetical protein J3458_021022 [Metarhizium acridum]|uniref:uncharacterized protein n=1 Tax=Metarhizium acridum TaxID=92637 RepID=UPI001C6CCEC5|nr:hypothetical protein J3458_021022 [Metarhizium acridum]